MSKNMAWRADKSCGRFCCGCLLVLSVSAGAAFGAQVPELTLLHADGDVINLVLTPDGAAPLVFHHAGAAQVTYQLDVAGPFVSGGQELAVVIGTPGSDEFERVSSLKFGPDEFRRALELRASQPVPGVTYAGKISVSAQGREPQSWTVNAIVPLALGELEADVSRADLELVDGSGDNPKFIITLREKSGRIPLDGITVRRAPGSEVLADFDLQQDLVFSLDGKRINDITSWSAANTEPVRRIPAGGQRTLEVEVLGLPRGEHKLAFEIDAENLESGTAPKVELNVNVRHPRYRPVAVLLLAIILSYFISKGIVNWRQRNRLKHLAQRCAQEWLSDFRDFAPVVWLQASRRQALITLERFVLLPAPQDITERLETSLRILNIMKRYREVERKVNQNIAQYMLLYRFGQALKDVVNSIDPYQLDSTNEAALLGELDGLDQAIDDPSVRYRPYVMSSQNRTSGMNVLSRLSGIDAAKLKALQDLWNAYVAKPVDASTSLDDLMLVDRVCASMRILNRHLDFDDAEVVRDLVDVIARPAASDLDVRHVFRITNLNIWQKIKAAVAAGSVNISPSDKRPSATPRKALEPTTFRVEMDDPRLNDSFMAEHRMTIDWEFDLTPAKSWFSGRKMLSRWMTQATGKSLLQFAPDSGTLKTFATLRHDLDASERIAGQIEVHKSSAWSSSEVFALQEIVLVVVAGAIAFASGLVMFYESNASFGSIQDYLALFTWGVGVDQGKNLAQTLTGLSTQSEGRNPTS